MNFKLSGHGVLSIERAKYEEEICCLLFNGISEITKSITDFVFLSNEGFVIRVPTKAVSKQMTLPIPLPEDLKIIYNRAFPQKISAVRTRSKFVDPNMFFRLELIIGGPGNSYFVYGPDKCKVPRDGTKKEMIEDYLKLVNLFMATTERKAINFNLKKNTLNL